jgi:hypothetical protein
MAAVHAPTLLTEPRDWRAMERWLRETEQRWREGDLGSVEPAAWKALDGELKIALAPVRDALSSARGEAKAARQALIAEVTALAPHATDRDAPARVRAIQARWQEQAKALPLPQRDERAMWDAFRAGCDAVFTARDGRRKEDDEKQQQGRDALEKLCGVAESLASTDDGDESALRRRIRELRDEWSRTAGTQRVLPVIEARFRKAIAAADGVFAIRARSRESAKWATLAAKERLCDELDRMLLTDTDLPTAAPAIATMRADWAALPSLPNPWDARLEARRDAALRALEDPALRRDHRARIDAGRAARGDALIDLEMLAGLETPPEFKERRLALQVQKLKARFSGGADGGVNAGDRLLAWCAQPGVCEPRDRQRLDAVVTAMAGLR